LIYNIKLVLINRTQIESFNPSEEPFVKKFNLTRLENWEQVFGKNKLTWFFPIPTEKGKPDGDGITWKTNDRIHNE
jgi:palmitoyltransferase